MHSNFSVQCPHGYRLIDQDECTECIKLEIVKAEVIHEVKEEMLRVTDESDSAMRALFLTAVGRYVSMKLHRIQDAHRVLAGAMQSLHTALPCAPESKLLAQSQFLTELSFAARAVD